MTIFGTLSRALNRATGGHKDQTLCARIAASKPDCLFCRLMSWAIEKDHCAIELALWRAHTAALHVATTSRNTP